MDCSMIDRWLRAVLYNGMVKPSRSLRRRMTARGVPVMPSASQPEDHSGSSKACESLDLNDCDVLAQAQSGRLPESYETEDDYKEAVSRCGGGCPK